MSDRPDPSRDFKAASDRFQQAMADAAEKTTAAEAEATLSAAIEDYNRAVDAYNAHAEQYNREHGLTEDDDAETLRYLVRNGNTATLEAKPAALTAGPDPAAVEAATRTPGHRCGVTSVHGGIRHHCILNTAAHKAHECGDCGHMWADDGRDFETALAERDALAARVAELEAEREATAGFVAIWHDTALVQHEVDEIRCQACRSYMAGPLPLPSPVTLADLVALASRHECLPRPADAALVARDQETGR